MNEKARDLTPPYGHLSRLVKPFPDFDVRFMRRVRQRAVELLHLKKGDRVLDVGCGPGGGFPYLVRAVGPSGEVVGVEISPEISVNARRRIQKNGWQNVRVIEAAAEDVDLTGQFDGLLMFAAADIYASEEALANILPHLRAGARVVAFGYKLSRHPLGRMLNPVFRLLVSTLSFPTTPRPEYEPWRILAKRLVGLQVEEDLLGTMFLASGSLKHEPARRPGMPGAIRFLHEVASEDAVGGKARGLATLIAAGFPVPGGFVVLPEARDEEIAAAYRLLGPGPVAVRSSAEEEDSETRSYAGQLDSFLDVVGEERVAEAVKACRASARNARVASYLEEGVARSTRIPVIVQRMVRPDYAGVAFAIPDGPTIVEGVAGLAHPLVSGRARPMPLPTLVRERVELLALEVMERLGSAQDIEWAVEGGRTWLLQARALTAPVPVPLPHQVRLWTAANVQEAIPRPLTPLSEELTVVSMSRIFRESFAFAGLPQPRESIVRFVNGRVYMSYSALASAMSANGFRIEKLLLMFGDSPELAPLIAYRPGPKRFLRLPAALLRLVGWFLFAERYIARAQSASKRFERRVRSALAGDTTDGQLLELLRSLKTGDPAPFRAMSVATSMANQLLGTLMSAHTEPHGTARVDAAAWAAAGDLESLEPARRLAALAEWLRANPDHPDSSAEVQAHLADFMEACGFRCDEEAELARPRWSEQPAEVLRLARRMASAPVSSPAVMALPTAGSPPPGTRLRILAAQARLWQRRRERMRATLSSVGASVRFLFLAIGRRLHGRKLLNTPDDIFFLLCDEIISLLDTPPSETALAEALAARIARRRARYRRLLASPAPSRLLAELADGRLAPFAPAPAGDALHGCGVSPGRVTGRARVMRYLGEVQTLEPGEVLVARTTDIGWTPLFRLASAVVTEIGAPTSHAAIVARELGLPAVVNVDRVTERITTGDVLFVDGWAGLVRRLTEGGPSTDSARTSVTVAGEV